MTSPLKNEYVQNWVARACRGLLAGIFIFAALPKLYDLDTFRSIIDTYGILPDRWLTPFALGLIGLELAAGLGLLVKRQRWRDIALVLTLCLLLFFIAILGYGIWQGLGIDCGCFGKQEPEYKFFSSLKFALIRDLLLLLPVFYLFWHRRRKSRTRE